MSFYFITGFSLGTFYPQICKNQTYLLLFEGLYKPHRDHKLKKKQNFAKGLGMSENDYYYYFLNIFYSFGNMFYNIFFLNNYNMKMNRQNHLLKLIDKFGLVNETIQNYDIIVERLYTLNNTPEKSTYAELQKYERESKRVNYDSYHENNINAFKNLAQKDKNTSEYEKKVLGKAVTSRLEYEDNISLQSEIDDFEKNRELLQNYEKSLKEWTRKSKKDDLDEFISDLRIRREEDIEKRMNENIQKINDPQYQKQQQMEQQLKRRVDPKQLELMKSIFGEKK